MSISLSSPRKDISHFYSIALDSNKGRLLSDKEKEFSTEAKNWFEKNYNSSNSSVQLVESSAKEIIEKYASVIQQGKRYRFKISSYRHDLLTVLFHKSYLVNANNIVATAKSYKLNTFDFYPSTKRKLKIVIPKKISEVLNFNFRAAISFVTCIAFFKISYKIYNHTSLLVGRVTPFIINHTSLKVIKLWNLILKSIDFIKEIRWKIWLIVLVAEVIIHRFPMFNNRFLHFINADRIFNVLFSVPSTLTRFVLSSSFNFLKLNLEFWHNINLNIKEIAEKNHRIAQEIDKRAALKTWHLLTAEKFFLNDKYSSVNA